MVEDRSRIRKASCSRCTDELHIDHSCYQICMYLPLVSDHPLNSQHDLHKENINYAKELGSDRHFSSLLSLTAESEVVLYGPWYQTTPIAKKYVAGKRHKYYQIF